jgi:hypothetical protein
MTDRFLLVDAALWSLAVALFALALWLTRRENANGWDPAVFFGGALAALFSGERLPLAEGPVPAAGWDGKPDELEPAYHPETRLAADVTWAALAAWAPPAEAAVARRAAGVRLVWLEPPVVDIPGFEAAVCAPAEVEGLLRRPEDRLVLVASAAAQDALVLLRAEAGLRDRLRAVLFVAPRLDAAWLGEHFTHAAFDVEVAREVPFLTLRTPPDAGAQRLPEPARTASGFAPVAVVDLGVLPAEHLGSPRVGRALAALLAALG